MLGHSALRFVATSIGMTSDFASRALEVFHFQAARCAPYGQYLALLGVDPHAVKSVDEIPFLPIEIFRSHRVYCGTTAPELIFDSSGTTGGETSHHYVASAALYEQSFVDAFTHFYGSPSRYSLHTMLPSYRAGSSLLYMVDRLNKLCTGSEILLLGVTFALLEAAREGYHGPQPAIVMETGGMKGRGQEIERSLLHNELCAAFGVCSIHSEYGMCELLSQAYSSGDGIFRPAPSMAIMVRDLLNPLHMVANETVGGINIIDLSNRYSCSFIATGDQGLRHADGSFEVLGRIEGEILRGCNMLQ